MEFHTAIFKLKEHLFEVQPIELSFEIQTKRGAPQSAIYFYDLPALEHKSNSQRDQVDFLINCNYDFFTSNPDASDN